MELLIDHTDFESRINPWNGWRKGPNGQTLAVTSDGANHWAHFENFAGNLLGRVISKELTGLVPDTDYHLSMRVKRNGNSSKTPHLSFELDGIPLEGEFAVTAPEWQILRWQFRAREHSHAIELIGRDDTGNGSDHGADFSFDDIRIYPVTITENLDGQPAQTISQGEEIQLLRKTMTIKLLEDPLGIKAFIEPTAAEPGMREGPAITLQRQQHHQPNNPQKLQITPVLPCSELKFFWTWKQFPGEVEFYGLHGNLLATLSYTGEPRDHEVKYNAPDGEQIAWIVVICRDYAYLDNFTLTTA
ncbi:hypothetical protein EI533_05535 [Pseudomonas donghuensis]|nr:hypothetical protein [Pseudomonas donghuensis]